MRPALVLLALPAIGAGVEIPQGARTVLSMVNSISTKTAREADPVYLRTAFPIVVEGRIVVPVDSYVRGVVSQARRSGRVKGRAELGILIDSLTLPSGKQVQASPHFNTVGTEDLP